MNDVGLNLVELRATKGGEVAAFRRSFRFVSFPDVWGGRLKGEGKKRRERGLKWGIGAYGERQRGAGRVFLGCISPLIGRVVGVWLGAALRWRRMAFNGRLNSV